MPSYQLTLSPDYVPDWGSNEALRELFQNGIDRENETVGESKFYVNYTVFDRRLILGNPNTYLHKSTLLLGKTTKDGKTTIGKYGEGYKLALLVLLRQGCRIRIENSNEVWIPRIVKSRTFGCDIIQIEVLKNKNDDGWLRYIIDGITPEQYSDFQEKCLLFYPNTPSLKVKDEGTILLDPRFKSKIFCNGLYVCSYEGLEYGYDIPPDKISLNRDRNKVDSFNLTWRTSTIWRFIDEVLGTRQKQEEYSKKIFNMLRKNVPDVQYYTDIFHYAKDSIYADVCEMEYKDFIKRHGVKAVVVKDEKERDFIRKKYGDLVPIVVPEREYILIGESSSYKHLNISSYKEETPLTWVQEWLENNDVLPDKKALLLAEAEKWRYA